MGYVRDGVWEHQIEECGDTDVPTTLSAGEWRRVADALLPRYPAVASCVAAATRGLRLRLAPDVLVTVWGSAAFAALVRSTAVDALVAMPPLVAAEAVAAAERLVAMAAD